MFFSLLDPPGDAAASTLIVPAICHGNVGQLAVDLLLTNREHTRQGVLEDDTMLPCVGNDAVGLQASGRLSSAMELFRIGNDVSCLQVRGEVVPGCQREHAHRVAQWVQGRGVRQVVVLASVTSREQSRPDSVTGSRSLRFWCQGDEALRAACEGAGCSELDQATASDRPEAERRTQPWPLIRELSAAGIPVAVLFKIVSAEGDNREDALAVASVAAQVGGLVGTAPGAAEEAWRAPLSWQAGLYGPAAVY